MHIPQAQVSHNYTGASHSKSKRNWYWWPVTSVPSDKELAAAEPHHSSPGSRLQPLPAGHHIALQRAHPGTLPGLCSGLFFRICCRNTWDFSSGP